MAPSSSVRSITLHFPARLGVALAAIAACGCSSGTDPIPAPGPPAAVQVSPTARTLVHLDETAPFSAVVTDADGTVVPDIAVTWESGDESIATVDASGTVTAHGFGVASITAHAGALSRSATVTITGESDPTFLEGSWTVDATEAPPGVDDAATVWVGRDQGGALRVVWTGSQNNVPVQAVALVAPRGGTNRWYAARVDGVRGRYAVYDGVVERGRIELGTGPRFGGSNEERIVLSEFRATSFRWTLESSDDAGVTWATVEDAIWSRAAASSAPADLTTPSAACLDPERRAFDFWEGDWTVRVPSGGVAGTNLIHLVGGCGIQENWRDAGSGGGVSLNGYDPVSDRWGQFYFASTGGMIEIWGTSGANSMTLEGPQFGNASVTDRVVWTLLDDGRVRQKWDANAGGGWNLVFDGYYSRR